MPKYYFTARSQKGENFSGSREAKNEHDLARSLRNDGHLLVSVTETKDGRSFLKKRSQIFNFLGGGVPLKEKLFFVRNLQVMISAGVSLPKSLTVLSEQAKNSKFKRVLSDVAEAIVKGEHFSSVIAKYPEVFSNLFVSIVKVGEESGTLEANLVILARQMEREHELKTKVRGAMIYPLVIAMAMIGIGILMLIMVVPQLAEVFEEFGTSLPLSTRIIIALGDFFKERWYLLALIVFVFLLLAKAALKTGPIKKLLAGFLLKVPIISPLVKKINATYTVRTLSSLIVAGTPLIRSLQIASETISNFYFRKAIEKAIDKVKKGEKLSEALRPYQNLYSPTVIQMIEVGEETGETSGVLQKLADFYEEEVGDATKNLSSVVEPIMMLLIGGIVGFFAVSMVQPIYSMMGVL